MEHENRINLRPGIIASALILLFMAALSAYGWWAVPSGEQVPVHWGFDGEPDRYGSKLEALGLMPAIVAAVALLLYFLPRIEPRKLNLERSRKAYLAVWMAILGIFAAVHAGCVLSAVGKEIDMTLLGAALGLALVVMGNYMGKIRSNFFIGFRTPWTLSSELSWNKTHRLAGWMMALYGVSIACAALFFRSHHIVLWSLISAGSAVVIVVPAVYSYLVWRGDPNRHGVEN